MRCIVLCYVVPCCNVHSVCYCVFYSICERRSIESATPLNVQFYPYTTLYAKLNWSTANFANILNSRTVNILNPRAGTFLFGFSGSCDRRFCHTYFVSFTFSSVSVVFVLFIFVFNAVFIYWLFLCAVFRMNHRRLFS